MPTNEPKSPGLAYRDLKQRSDLYDIETWEMIDAFYEGGFRIAKNAAKYMPPMVGEHRARYKERLQSSAYLNYLGQIVDYFTSALFSQELTIAPAPDADDPNSPGGEPPDPESYAAWEKDADGKGTKLVDVLKTVLTTAMLKRRGLLCLDLPAAPEGFVPANRADEERAGLGRPLAFELPLDQVIDWDYDDDGGFSYLVIHRKIDTKAPPGKRKGTVVEEFKIWEKLETDESIDTRAFNDQDSDGAKPIITFRTYRLEYKKDDAPKDDTVVPCVAEGDVSFDRIPVLEFGVPLGLWIGNKLVPVAREHFTRRTALNAGENRSLVSIPYVCKGSEMGAAGGAIPSEAQQNPHRGNDPVGTFAEQGWVELGQDDTLGFAEPTGSAYELVDRQLDRLKDEMFRISHQMAMSVSNNSTTLNRSGQSKKEDRVAEGIVLGEYGRCVRNFAVLAYDTVSKARNEDVVWNAHGLDDFDQDDRADLLEEAMSIDLVPINSPTFKKFWKGQLAKGLAKGATPETLAQMVKEIEESTEAEDGMRVEADTAEHETKLDTLKATSKAAKSPNFGKPAGRPRPFV